MAEETGWTALARQQIVQLIAYVLPLPVWLGGGDNMNATLAMAGKLLSVPQSAMITDSLMGDQFVVSVVLLESPMTDLARHLNGYIERIRNDPLWQEYRECLVHRNYERADEIMREMAREVGGDDE